MGDLKDNISVAAPSRLEKYFCNQFGVCHRKKKGYGQDAHESWHNLGAEKPSSLNHISCFLIFDSNFWTNRMRANPFQHRFINIG